MGTSTYRRNVRVQLPFSDAFCVNSDLDLYSLGLFQTNPLEEVWPALLVDSKHTPNATQYQDPSQPLPVAPVLFLKQARMGTLLLPRSGRRGSGHQRTWLSPSRTNPSPPSPCPHILADSRLGIWRARCLHRWQPPTRALQEALESLRRRHPRRTARTMDLHPSPSQPLKTISRLLRHPYPGPAHGQP